jgi:hypothetical protein
MAQLHFNAATVDPQQSFDPLPDAWYTVIMTKSEMKPTKDGSGAYLESELTVQDPSHKGRKIYYRLNLKNTNPVAQEIAYKQLSAICHAVGVIQCEDSQQLHGLPFKVKVVIKRDDSGKYDPSNEVKAIKSVNEDGAPSAPAAPAFAAAQAPAPAPAAAGSVPPWMQKKE